MNHILQSGLTIFLIIIVSTAYCEQIETNKLTVKSSAEQVINAINLLEKKIHNIRVSDSTINPPVGSIIAWHRDFPNTPKLAIGWVECNGQRIDDKESPYFNLLAPDLNTPKGKLDGSFLRGGVKSGKIQDQDWKSIEIISREVNDGGKDGRYTHGPIKIPKDTKSKKEIFAGLYKSNNANVLGFQFDESEVRPINMSVIWILKIK